MNQEDAQAIEEVLNEALELDKDVVNSLCNRKIRCSGDIAFHPTIQCAYYDRFTDIVSDGGNGSELRLSVIGLINGFLIQCGYVLMAEIDEPNLGDGEIERFIVKKVTKEMGV